MTFAVEGDTVQLNCSTDDSVSVDWKHVSVASSSDTGDDVFVAGDVHSTRADRASIDSTSDGGPSNAYNLRIRNVAPKDSGRYACLDDGGLGERADGELVVLRKLNTCRQLKV